MDRLLKINPVTLGSINKLIEKIDKYNREWKLDESLSPEDIRELRHMATVRSIGSSTRIEGSTLGDEEVAKLIENMDIQKLESRDEQEVAGYFYVLEIIHEEFHELQLTVNLIKGLHNELLRHSTKDQYHRGNYKQHSNRVVATDAEGNQRTIFKTTGVFETDDAMRKAVDWYCAEISKKERHPLIVIATFIYEFLNIHPFQDGNGRLSRLLTNLLLLQNGYAFIMYSSLERAVEDNKTGYYRALMLAQRYRGTEDETIDRWVFFLLKAIYSLSDRLDEEQNHLVNEPQALYLNKRQTSILQFAKDDGPISVMEIDSLLPEISRNTVKYDLAKLTEAGYLRRLGKGRGTVYERVR